MPARAPGASAYIFPFPALSFRLCFYYQTASAAQNVACMSWANDGEWHLVMLSVSGLRLRLFVDNALVGSATLNGVVVDDSTATPRVTVGYRLPDRFHLRGQLDSVRLYYRALSYLDD